MWYYGRRPNVAFEARAIRVDMNIVDPGPDYTGSGLFTTTGDVRSELRTPARMVSNGVDGFYGGRSDLVSPEEIMCWERV